MANRLRRGDPPASKLAGTRVDRRALRYLVGRSAVTVPGACRRCERNAETVTVTQRLAARSAERKNARLARPLERAAVREESLRAAATVTNVEDDDQAGGQPV